MAFPNNKKMKKFIESLDSNPMDCRKNPMTMELWRYYILPYCDHEYMQKTAKHEDIDLGRLMET